MDNNLIKPASSSLAIALTMALSQLFVGSLAKADSVHEWAYWDSPELVSNTNPENSSDLNKETGQNINTDQRVVGIDNSQFVALKTPSTEDNRIIGYTLCYYNCNGGSGYYNATTAGTVRIEVIQGAERVADHYHYEWPFYNYVSDTSNYDGNLKVNGTYDGAAFNINDSAANLNNYSYSYNYRGSSYSGMSQNVSGGNDNAYFSGTLSASNTYNGVEYNNNPYQTGSISNANSSGFVAYGKPIAAAQIADQVRLGQTYNFNGYSFLGSYVQLAVNFQNASWSGSWDRGYNRQHNGFTAAGSISGSTLASNNVTGTGSAGVGFVTGGNVNATLVGVIRGADASAAGVIGKTVVTVQQTIGTKTVADVFCAGGSYGGCGGD